MINIQLVGYGVSNRSRIMQCQACLFFISLGEFNSSREGLVWQSTSVDLKKIRLVVNMSVKAVSSCKDTNRIRTIQYLRETMKP